MVLQIIKTDFDPDKEDACLQRVPGAVKRILSVTGIKGFGLSYL